jgi:DNA-binding response OmpR family regulator
MAEQARQPQCVLVVDGDILVRHAIADYLRQCGFVVIEAATTDEAETVFGETLPAVVAVLCDAEATGKRNAFRFRTWVLEQGRVVNFLLAGNIEAAARKAAELCEQGHYLARPYDPQSVVEYIRRLLGSEPSASARIQTERPSL